MLELFEYEKSFLINHNADKKYNLLCSKMIGYSKNDILWVLYDELKNAYLIKKDYLNCFLVYRQMANQLYVEKKYQQSVHFLILALYIRICDIVSDCIETGLSTNMMYERHISKHHKDLKKYMKKANMSNIINTDEMCDFVEKIIVQYLPDLKNNYWIYWLSFKYIDYIS